MKMILKAALILTAALSIAACSKKSGSQEASAAVSSEPAVEIAFGDYGAMEAFAGKMQNGEFKEGQTVKIDGELSVFMSASIGQRNDDNFIGTTIEFEDISQDEYPEDGSHVKVTATVKKNQEYGFCYLTAKSSDMTVFDGE